ncbi:MAG: hypothetical protein FJZ78_01850 [Bacteroidetes bacterium]|nr:hypothetical protein [Bacteroidota bacterium]
MGILAESFGLAVEYFVVDVDNLKLAKVPAEVYSLSFQGPYQLFRSPQPGIIRLTANTARQNINYLDYGLAETVVAINTKLAAHKMCLMPGSMHPLSKSSELAGFMPANPSEEAMAKLFTPSGHGWLNRAGCDVRLSFLDDDEFSRLHAAARIILPIVPALTASSPVFEGMRTGLRSNSWKNFIDRYSKFPDLQAGEIPEPVFSEKKYEETILDPIRKMVASKGLGEVLSAEVINARAVTADFKSKEIVIQSTESQECPAAQMAVSRLIMEAIRAMANEQWVTHEQQMRAVTSNLAGLIIESAEGGMGAEVFSSEYLSFFGMDDTKTIREVWRHIFETLSLNPEKPLARYEQELSVILQQGSLSDRVLTVLGENPQQDQVLSVYKNLCDCLNQNRLFIL